VGRAHRVRIRFPDGQLYVNLRGYDPDQPLSAGYALAGFLHALGVPGQEIPPELDERASLYRSRPLLPGTPSALVVVTSRDALAGSVGRHGWITGWCRADDCNGQDSGWPHG